jgi:hypothetical protein
MATSPGIAINAFGCHVRASADCEGAFSVLDRYIWPSLPRANCVEVSPADIDIRIERSEQQFQLLVDGAAVAFSDDAIGLVPSIVHVIDEAMLQRLTTFCAVHAGVVLWGERALLLPGGTHAGKSSLVVELLRRGAEYFSDEYALIDDEGRVHPYPRPLMVRNGSPEQLPKLASDYNATVSAVPAAVGWIFSLQYERGKDWNVTGAPQSIALLDLLRNTPQVLADSPEIVDGFQRAVEGAACYSGIRGDAVDAAERILAIVGNPDRLGVAEPVR